MSARLQTTAYAAGTLLAFAVILLAESAIWRSAADLRVQSEAANAEALARSETLQAQVHELESAWTEPNGSAARTQLGVLRELAGAERKARAARLAEAEMSMDRLLRNLALSSIVLIVAGAVLALLIYQGFIAPLRARLRESGVVIERQEKLSSLGVLAAGVAHEVRNPLTSIKARLFTQKSLLEERSEAWEDNVFITEEISRLEKIVRDFLAFARPSEPQLARLRAADPFRDLRSLAERGLQKANIALREDFQTEAQIEADPGQIKQVLLNLVQNAAESIGQDGAITLRTRLETRKRLSQPARVVLLEVEDTGGGVPPEVKRRLFDPFFTTKASGTGLGLSIAARILEKHRGALEHQNVRDRGALFRLVLPLAENHERNENLAGG